MIKAFFPQSFNFDSLSEPLAEIIKVSSTGSIDQKHIKRSNLFNRLLSEVDLQDDKTLVHTIAMSASDKYGFNRNGDGWTKLNLQRDCPTFKTCAKVYRHHKHSETDPSYGTVEAVLYNDDMDRVELLLALDNEKAAEELDLLEKKGSFSVSMAAKVAYDQCSICDNKAKSPSEYCECVRTKLGEILDDGRQVGVDNPDSIFFDISRVIKPADRIAYTLRKAASEQSIGGVKLAENLGYNLPSNLYINTLPGIAKERLEIFNKLSSMKKQIEGKVCPVIEKDQEEEKEINEIVDQLSEHSKHSLDKVVKSLQKYSIVLNPEQYFRLMSGKSLVTKTADAVRYELNRMLSLTDQKEELFKDSSYEACEYDIAGKIDELCKKLSVYCGLNKTSFINKMVTNKNFNYNVVKKASVKEGISSDTRELAEEYMKFKLETLRGIKKNCSKEEFDSVIICATISSSI